MGHEAFQVGDQVYLTTIKRFGKVIQVTVRKPIDEPDAPGVRRYDIQLDDGSIERGLYRGIDRADEHEQSPEDKS